MCMFVSKSKAHTAKIGKLLIKPLRGESGKGSVKQKLVLNYHAGTSEVVERKLKETRTAT